MHKKGNYSRQYTCGIWEETVLNSLNRSEAKSESTTFYAGYNLARLPQNWNLTVGSTNRHHHWMTFLPVSISNFPFKIPNWTFVHFSIYRSYRFILPLNIYIEPVFTVCHFTSFNFIYHYDSWFPYFASYFITYLKPERKTDFQIVISFPLGQNKLASELRSHFNVGKMLIILYVKYDSQIC